MDIDIKKVISEVANLLTYQKHPINNKQYYNYVKSVTGLSIANGDFTAQRGYDILEGAINYVVKKYIAREPKAANYTGYYYAEELMKIVPTQNIRSYSKVALQQYSTPLTVSYFMANLLNVKQGELIFEPTAGTGNLLTFIDSKNICANECDSFRARILRELGYLTTEEDAMYLTSSKHYKHSQFDKIIMNPPFSTRLNSNKTNVSNGIRYITEALYLLKDGGKMVVLFGESIMNHLNEFKSKLEEFSGCVTHNYSMPGKFFYKNGTTYNFNVLVIEKRQCNVLEGIEPYQIKNIEELLNT